MKIFTLESIDSTSDHASRLLQGEGLTKASGANPPFVVLARQQTQGRGRSGKSWLSPAGGIYGTLVLSAATIPGPERGTLPLVVACSLASWIEQQFGLRVTIKWPNDLLFAGAKLAGILCESSVQGQDWGPVLIGIGLNLQEAPAVSEQASISMAQLLPLASISALDAFELGRSLFTFIEQELHTAHADILARFPSYGIEAGQLWIDAQGAFARVKGLSSDGQLQLENLPGTLTLDLSSVRHEWQWIYQKAVPPPLLLADIGNSLVKLLVSWPGEPGREPLFLRFKQTEETTFELLEDSSTSQGLASLKKSLGLPVGWPIHAIAVNDRLLAGFRAYAENHGFQIATVPKRPLRVRFDRYRFDELGIDRLAMVEAARAAWPEKNLILVSAGTAVTIEISSADGYYQGGYILAGLQTKLSALHARTARLPLIELAKTEAQQLLQGGLLGRDTRSSMLRGAVRETALAVRGLALELEKELGFKDWTIVCTGGDGELLASLLEAPYCPRLILDGAAAMVLGGRLLSSSSGFAR